MHLRKGKLCKTFEYFKANWLRQYVGNFLLLLDCFAQSSFASNKFSFFIFMSDEHKIIVELSSLPIKVLSFSGWTRTPLGSHISFRTFNYSYLLSQDAQIIFSIVSSRFLELADASISWPRNFHSWISFSGPCYL